MNKVLRPKSQQIMMIIQNHRRKPHLIILQQRLLQPTSVPTPIATPNAPINYYNQAPITFDNRNGATGFVLTTPPTPQDYPSMTFTGRFTNEMMTTFSSRTVSSTPKRYKCTVCQKRFTRPSSLQTHMYSHTGEKRFEKIKIRN
ncbi:456_t:CDS:2 [Entrophospora sp. SA101]|nr:456_t:CDS:2 [Entrophospora sp. SA101]